MRVLSAASECVPLVKTGGLADVAGALPGALAPHGVEMRVLLPGYRKVLAALGDAPVALDLGDVYGSRARILQGKMGGRGHYVMDAPHLFDRDGGLYAGPDGRDWPDNPERFAAFSYAAARMAADGAGDWRPDVLHLHDWQTGFAPVYLDQMGARGRVGTVFTIHNVAYQGLAPGHALNRLGLPFDGFTPQGFEYWGNISALKAGILWSHKVTTVSPTYMRELTTPEFGIGMQDAIRARAADSLGILNGIDLDVWAPPFADLAGKAVLKARLRDRFGLPAWDGPLCVVVSRLTGQKGLDLLLGALPALVDRGGQLILLGSGARALEDAWRGAARHPGVAVHIGYDEALAFDLIAGGDAILVPSRFEPCGLTQLYGLRMGTVPVVAATGGLVDTVIDAQTATLAAGVATGLKFWPVTTHELAQALLRLHDLWQDTETWERMQRNGMAHPVGWDASARQYAALYRDIATAR